jgi:hypothetical protein
MRKATELSVASIKSIGNVGAILYSPETGNLISRLNIGNAGDSIEVPESEDIEFRTLTGQTTFGPNYFKDQAKPLNLIVTGQTIVNPEIPLADIQTGLGMLIVVGQMVCPEHLAGAIQAKCRNVIGHMQTYPYTPSARFTIGNLVLDESYLNSLDADSDLVVVGDLNLPQVLSNDLLAQKVRSVVVTGRVTCREENAPVLLGRLDRKSGGPKVTTIPAGFEVVDKSLVLDASTLETLSATKLYCTRDVRIDADVTPETLGSKLERLVVQGHVICPEALKGVLAQKCNMLETEVVFYEGELWLIEDELTLQASRFDYLEGKATLVVFGDLRIASDIEPQTLAERLAKVHNFGDITCTPEQMSAIQARLGVNKGDLIDATQQEAEEEEEGEDGGGIGNIGYLPL